ncbi:MAG TPA: hypothetical protein VHY22_05470 [Chthoniobacteraceae bacterium]|jgi:hypothetical protein|nr:hypothetical protein [Chthoniobacteraceae bacterium]
MNLTLLSQAELRQMKADLTQRCHKRDTKRLQAVINELNARFGHLTGAWFVGTDKFGTQLWGRYRKSYDLP